MTQPNGYRRRRNMHTIIVPPDIWAAGVAAARETGTTASAVCTTALAELAGLAPRRVTCQWCGVRFIPRRRTARFCSPEHRWAYNATKKPTTRAGRADRARK